MPIASPGAPTISYWSRGIGSAWRRWPRRLRQETGVAIDILEADPTQADAAIRIVADHKALPLNLHGLVGPQRVGGVYRRATSWPRGALAPRAPSGRSSSMIAASPTGPARAGFAPPRFCSGPRMPRRRLAPCGRVRNDETTVLRRRPRPCPGEGAGHRPAPIRNALASHTGGGTQGEARAVLHGVHVPQAGCARLRSLGSVHVARLTPGRWCATA